MSARSGRWILLALVAIVGAIAGAVWDWYNWHPTAAIMITLLAIPLVVIGGVLLIIRARRSRQVGSVVLALGLGIVVGQVLGPSRPDLMHYAGTVTVTLESPKATTGNHDATCELTEAGTDLRISLYTRLDVIDDDPNAPADIDQREFVGISVTVGDRWRGAFSRSDDVDLRLMVHRVEADLPATVMVADDASSIDIEWTNNGGTLRFAGLVSGPVNDGEPVGEPIDLRGTIEWTCGS